MPLFDETVAFTGLSKPSDMSGFILKPVLQYGGAYFSYNPRAKDASELTSPWSNSSTTLLDTRGPISHASGATTGGDNSSLPYDNPVFLAIPKAVYGHNPCCHDLGCMMGHRYSGEHRSQTGATADFEHSWTRGEAYHSQISPLQQKGQDKLQGLPLHPSEEQVKSTITESLSRGRPTRMGPNYSGYPCVSPLSMATSLSEQSRHLQPSPGGYAGFHPSHATYEHMTSELYQECSPMSKYGHPTKHSMFYYPQANAEVENRTHCGDVGGKQREDVPVAQKSPIANPRERYTFPQTLHGDIPLFLHSTETQPNHTFLQGFGYPCYARPGFPSGPIRNVERHHLPPGLLSHRISVSPSDQCLSPSASLQKSTTNRHFTPLDTSHSFLRLDPISPTQHVGQSGLPSCIQISRLYPSITHRLDPQIDQPVLKPSGLTKDRLLDQSSNVCQFTCPKHPKDHQVSPGTLLSQSPKRGTDCLHSTLTNGPDFGTVIATTKKHNGLAYNSAVSFLKGGMKRPFPSLLKIKEEPLDLCEVDLSRKRRKLEMEGVLKRNQESPEMPVIDNVFSLAPDLRYLKTPGVLLPELQHQRSMLMLLTEHCKVQPTTLLKEIKPDPAEQPIYVCPQRPEAQLIEPGKIKVENINQSDPRDSSENCPSHTACSTIPDQIKLQPEDESLSDSKSTLVIQICKPEKLECKPSSPEADDPSYPPKSPSSQSVRNDRTPEDQVVNTEPKPASPLKPPEAELDVKTSPPESLVCSTYNTHPADMEVCRPPAPQEAPLQIQEGSSPRKQKPQSVRKHFLELHRTLCKQVSKCVSNTSEQQLRTWRSQLELVEPSSTKVQKVSCLLGIKARHKWLNKEISSALQEVLDRFREYIVHKRCPFPHVMRTGAVFLPMLVIKEILFPLVPGNFIDQVLQEHKVELRPTTLSEEKILIQVHKPCTSRLRRLMSLKHLPNVYTDVLNLLYYSNVCKHLGVETATWEDPDILSSSSPAEDPKAKSHESNRTKTKSRVKSSSRRTFLDNSWSDDEDDDSGKHVEKESGKKSTGDDASPASPERTPSDNCWTRPLSSEDFPDSDVEPEKSSGFPAVCHPAVPSEFQLASRNGSGMIIKLKRREARKQAASVSADEGDQQVTFKWERTGRLGRTLRPLGGSRKRNKRSLRKIKYCPYLSACHSTERRRRWVLRSAVRRACGVLGPAYPDLVAKRIRHLYEEDDKSEVWYRGEVVRVHEAHGDPLKTVFEVRYDSEPEWKYYLELLSDYKKGWLIIEEDN